MPKFKWENGSKIAEANVEINGNIYNVNSAQFEGKTPLSAQNLNAMQDGIYEDITTIKELSNENILDYEESQGYLINEENKWLFNGIIPRYENKVYEKVLTANTTSLSIPCDILKHGGHYRLVILGKTTARTDLEITFNNNKTDVYYQSGVYYTGSGTNGDGTLSGMTGYRPAKSRIYFGINFFNQGFGKLEMNIHFDETDKKPFYKWNMDRTYSGDQMTGWGNGQVGGSGIGNNITSINIAPVSGSLAKGMKIQLFRD